MSRPGQCGSRLGILQERDVCELILRVTGLQDEADPNFQLALNFAWSNFRFHRFLDVNSHKIEKTIEGIYEKFVIHSDLSKAASWKRLTQEFLNASLPNFHCIYCSFQSDYCHLVSVNTQTFTLVPRLLLGLIIS
uniref:Gamma-tubulin complex component n=1 Tax=Castor canadensis TaxID=51338 RepID=A0A8C0WJ09_CASCN